MYSCGMCFTSGYQSEAQLWAHQHRRGHWRDIFDRKLRRQGKLAGRIPSEILTLTSDSDDDFNESQSSESVCLIFFRFFLSFINYLIFKLLKKKLSQFYRTRISMKM